MIFSFMTSYIRSVSYQARPRRSLYVYYPKSCNRGSPRHEYYKCVVGTQWRVNSPRSSEPSRQLATNALRSLRSEVRNLWSRFSPRPTTGSCKHRPLEYCLGQRERSSESEVKPRSLSILNWRRSDTASCQIERYGDSSR